MLCYVVRLKRPKKGVKQAAAKHKWSAGMQDGEAQCRRSAVCKVERDLRDECNVKEKRRDERLIAERDRVKNCCLPMWVL